MINENIVCHRLWSILWSIVQVCSLTIESHTVQYVPIFSIWGHFESTLLTTLPRISILRLVNDDHQCKKLILVGWWVVLFANSQYRSKILGVWKFFWSTRGNSGFKHGFVIFYKIFVYFTLCMIKEWCWFSQINFFDVIHVHRKELFFHNVRKSIPNWKRSPKHISIGFFKLPDPYKTCQRMIENISLKWNDWIFHSGQWFGPFVSWWTTQNVWKFGFGNFQ